MDYRDSYWLTLVVLFAPLVAAVLAALLGRLGGGVGRRFAVSFAMVHVAISAIAVASHYPALENRHLGQGQFRPVGVPGAPADGGAKRFDPYVGTTWTLMSLGSGVENGDQSEIRFFVGFDGLNIWLMMLTSILTFIAVLMSWKTAGEKSNGYFGWLFMLQSMVLGTFLAFDVIVFYAFFELTLIPAFFLIGHWGVGGGRRDAARKFFLYTLLGGVFTLAGIIGIVATNPLPIDEYGKLYTPKPANAYGPLPSEGPITFAIPRLMRNVQLWDGLIDRERGEAERSRKLAEDQLAAAGNDMTRQTAARIAVDQTTLAAEAARAAADRRHLSNAILFFCLIAGFAVKIPIVPFHTWLPSAYAEAPLGITLYLSGILAKLGTFGLIRLVIPLCPEPCVFYGQSVLGILGAIGIVYAAFCAFAQKDLKLLAAYSSISHLGMVILGLFALNPDGMTGAMVHMLAHGLSAAMLFACLTVLYDRYGTLDSNRYQGLFGRYPALTFFTMVACLASVGLPGLCNFVGEMLILAGLFNSQNTAAGYGLTIAAAAGIFLSAWYTFTMVRRVFFGPVLEPPLPPAQDAPPTDLNGREAVALGTLGLLCLALGVVPQYVITPMQPEMRLLSMLIFSSRSGESDPEERIPRGPLNNAIPWAPPGGPPPGVVNPGGPPGGAPKVGPPGGAPKGGPPGGAPKGGPPGGAPKGGPPAGAPKVPGPNN